MNLGHKSDINLKVIVKLLKSLQNYFKKLPFKKGKKTRQVYALLGGNILF